NSNVTTATQLPVLNAGTYEIQAVFNATTNYQIHTSTTSTFTIDKVTVAVGVKITPWAYGAYNPSLNYPEPIDAIPELGSPSFDWATTADLTTWTSWSTLPTAPVSYLVRVSYPGDSNHNPASATAGFSIGSSAGSAWVTIGNWMYAPGNVNVKAPVYGSTPSTYPNVAVHYSVKDANSWSTDVPFNAGLYTVRVSFSGLTPNYDDVAATYDFEITQATNGSGTVSVAGGGWTFNQSPSLASHTVSSGYGDYTVATYEYKLTSADDIPTNWLPWSGISSTTPAGDYTIRVLFTPTTNYAAPTTAPTSTFEIAKAAGAVTVTMGDWAYAPGNINAKNPSSGVITGDYVTQGITPAFWYKAKGADDSTYTQTKPSTGGDWTVQVRYGTTNNYEEATETDDFEITPAEGAAIISVPDNGWTYNTTPPTPSVTVLAGDYSAPEIEYKLGAGSWLPWSGISSTTGASPTAYDIRATFAATDNYKQLIVFNTFTIAKATGVVTVGITGWVYAPGNANADSPTPGVDTGDYVAQGIVPTFWYTNRAPTPLYSSATVPADAGFYTVTVTYGTTNNYLLATASADFEITQATNGSGTVSVTGWTYNAYSGSTNAPSSSPSPGDYTVAAYEYKLTSDLTDTWLPWSNISLTTPAGDYTVRVLFTATRNYAAPLNAPTSTFEITPASGVVTVGITGWVYAPGNANANSPTPGVTTGDYVAEGIVPTFWYTNRAPTPLYGSGTVPTNAGLYTVTVTYGATNNYLQATNSANFEIIKATVTVSVTLGDWAFGTGHSTPVPYNGGVAELGSPAYYWATTAAPEVWTDWAITKPTAIGYYILRISYPGDSNYNPADATTTFEITVNSAGSGWVTISDWTYGEENADELDYGFTAGNYVAFQTHYTVRYANTWEEGLPTDAGLYTVRITFVATFEYAATTATADFQIFQAQGSMIVTIQNWTFGEPEEEPQLSDVTGDYAAEGKVVLFEYKLFDANDSAYDAQVPTNAGRYMVRATYGATTNYKAASATTDFSIFKATAEVTVSLASWMFGDAAKDPEYTTSGDHDAPEYWFKLATQLDDDYTKIKPSDAGAYTIKAVFAETVNYEGVSITSGFTIEKAYGSGTISIEDWYYKAAPNSVNETLIVGIWTTKVIEYKPASADDSAYSETVPTVGGDYIVRVTYDSTNNYHEYIAIASFSILRINGSIEVELEGWTYGDQAEEAVIKINDGDYVLSTAIAEYKIAGASDLTYTTAVPQDAGEYTVRVTVLATNNYNSTSATFNFEIARADGLISVIITGWVFNENPNEPIVTVLEGHYFGAIITIEYKVAGANDLTYTTDIPDLVGSYTVRVTYGNSQNFNETSATADFEVYALRGMLEIKISGWTYGDSAKAPEIVDIFGDYIEENAVATIQYKVAGANDSTYTAAVPTNAGDYTVRYSLSGTDIFAPVSATVDFTINKRTIVLSVSLADAEVGYNGQGQTIVLQGTLPDNVTAVYYYKFETAPDSEYGTAKPVGAGVYTVKVEFVLADSVNFNAIPSMTALLTITEQPFSMMFVYILVVLVVFMLLLLVLLLLERRRRKRRIAVTGFGS
ncbi:MAG: hypothetical protein FWE53_04790, partial [Firmicutes bacterium]|nr:hypothetical protein [Bacillota bacterium]